MKRNEATEWMKKKMLAFFSCEFSNTIQKLFSVFGPSVCVFFIFDPWFDF